MSNKSVSLKHRQAVVLWLRLSGLPVTQKRDFAGKVSDALRAVTPAGDVQGLENWTLNTKSAVTRHLGAGVDSAKLDAARDGKKYSATVWYRQLAGVQESFVVMSLETFTDALAGTKAP